MSSVHGLKRRRRRGAAQADRTLPILVLSVILGVGTMQVLKSIFGDDGPSKPAPAARADPTTAPLAVATSEEVEPVLAAAPETAAPAPSKPATARTPSSAGNTATLSLGTTGEVITYNMFDPRQNSLATEIRSMQAELEPMGQELEAAAKAIERDERWLRGSEAALNEMEQKINRWTRDYPQGLPDHIYYEARRVQDKYNEGVNAHNDRVAAAQRRVTSYQSKASEYDRRLRVYDAKWAELKRIAR